MIELSRSDDGTDDEAASDGHDHEPSDDASSTDDDSPIDFAAILESVIIDAIDSGSLLPIRPPAPRPVGRHPAQRTSPQSWHQPMHSFPSVTRGDWNTAVLAVASHHDFTDDAKRYSRVVFFLSSFFF